MIPVLVWRARLIEALVSLTHGNSVVYVPLIFYLAVVESSDYWISSSTSTRI